MAFDVQKQPVKSGFYPNCYALACFEDLIHAPFTGFQAHELPPVVVSCYVPLPPLHILYLSQPSSCRISWGLHASRRPLIFVPPAIQREWELDWGHPEASGQTLHTVGFKASAMGEGLWFKSSVC